MARGRNRYYPHRAFFMGWVGAPGSAEPGAFYGLTICSIQRLPSFHTSFHVQAG